MSEYYINELDDLIEKERKNGLEGIRLLVAANKDVTDDDIARSAAEMVRSVLAERCTDIDPDKLNLEFNISGS